MLTNEINELLNEKVITVELDDKKYQLNTQEAIKTLIAYEMDNPDMGNDIDFKDDKQRLLHLKKQLKGLAVKDITDQVEMLVSDGEVKISHLIKNKVIREV